MFRIDVTDIILNMCNSELEKNLFVFSFISKLSLAFKCRNTNLFFQIIALPLAIS